MQLVAHYPEVQALETEIVAASTDELSGAQRSVEQNGVPFPVLYDPSEEVPKAYEVFNLHGDNLASAATFIIDKEGRLRWSQIGATYDEHVPSETILRELRRAVGA